MVTRALGKPHLEHDPDDDDRVEQTSRQQLEYQVLRPHGTNSGDAPLPGRGARTRNLGSTTLSMTGPSRNIAATSTSFVTSRGVNEWPIAMSGCFRRSQSVPSLLSQPVASRRYGLHEHPAPIPTTIVSRWYQKSNVALNLKKRAITICWGLCQMVVLVVYVLFCARMVSALVRL
jgi:hypothetical protein